ncbi:MAG: hypothetical protein WBM46_06005 [Polyangiales bacterium]|jgi:hypothetical protein
MKLDANYLLLTLLVSSIGFVMFMYGRKQRRPLQVAGGIALLVFPFFVHGLLAISLITAVILIAVWGGVRLGL